MRPFTYSAACTFSASFWSALSFSKSGRNMEGALVGSFSKQRGFTSTTIFAAPPSAKEPRTGMSGIGWAWRIDWVSSTANRAERKRGRVMVEGA